MPSTIKLSETKKRSLTTVGEELLAPHIENGLVVEVDFSAPVAPDAHKAETNETPAAKKVCVLQSATTNVKGGKAVPEYPLQIRHVVCTHCDLLYTLEESVPPTKQCIDCGRSAIWKLCNPAAGCHCLSELSREMRELYSKAMRI